ncbi:uncharacterized protein [Ptychodera flava]|uniref:uncharacterized protein n=1 Tax=Ptychodera flava TaxID=63121 RepID=UPI00396A686E
MQKRDRQRDDLAAFGTNDSSDRAARSKWGNISISPLRMSPSVRAMSAWSSGNDGRSTLLSQTRIPLVASETLISKRESRLVTEARKLSPRTLSFNDADSLPSPVRVTSEPQCTVTECAVVEKSEKVHQNESVNSQLTKLNTIANVINFIKNKQIEKTISHGQRQLEKLQQMYGQQTGTIKQLNKSIRRLKMQVGQQSELSQRLEKSLQSQRELLEMSTQQSMQDISRHQNLLDKQEKMLNKLLSERLRHDLVVDGGILLYCNYLTHSTLVNFPLRTVLQLIKKPRLRKWLEQFSRLIIVLYLFKVLKSWTVSCGLHHSVGSFMIYCHRLVQYFQQRYYSGQEKATK